MGLGGWGVPGDLEDVVGCGTVPCASKTDTSGVEVGVSCGDVDSFQDDPQYKGMKYLVFRTILSSLLSELQIIIPKTDRNGVLTRN